MEMFSNGFCIETLIQSSKRLRKQNVSVKRM